MSPKVKEIILIIAFGILLLIYVVAIFALQFVLPYFYAISFVGGAGGVELAKWLAHVGFDTKPGESSSN